MPHPSQLERYKKLLDYLNTHFREEVNMEKVEEISHYSYRNINRIFEAIHQEPIGKYIKRLRLEKAAQFLKYSATGVNDIAYEVGFEDRAAFSKAFKARFGCSPLAYRNSTEQKRDEWHQHQLRQFSPDRTPLSFEVETLPPFPYVYIEYRGDYKDVETIEKYWTQLFEWAERSNWVNEASIPMSLILDDDEISDKQHSRFHLALTVDNPTPEKLEGYFQQGVHHDQKYVQFILQGTHNSCFDYYKEIYAFWMSEVGHEPADLPTLEFYPNLHKNPLEKDLITEIYIPIL